MGKTKKLTKKILAFCMSVFMCFQPLSSISVKAEENDGATTDFTVALADTENGSMEFYDSNSGQTYNDRKRIYEQNTNVEILFTPSEGYEVSGIKIFDNSGNLLDEMETNDEEFSFTMPSMDVVVDGEFTSTETTEILVGTEDVSIFRENENIISEYNGVYLLQFQNESEATEAYNYYFKCAEFVDMNDELEIAEDVTEDTTESTEETTEDIESVIENTENINSGDDALSTLNEIIEEDNTKKIDYTNSIAVIDTGINGNTIDAVSMISEDVTDTNGHGTDMYNAIISNYTDAKVVSVKAMDEDGKGQVSDVYAAIEYAISKNVSIINLSLYALDSANYDCIREAIKQAEDAGIIVVGASGNKGANVKYFVPGNIDYVITVGACDENGNRLSTSNYGDLVDGYLVASSTSEASAIMSALIARDGLEIAKSSLFTIGNNWYQNIFDTVDKDDYNNIANLSDEDKTVYTEITNKTNTWNSQISSLTPTDKTIRVKRMYASGNACGATSVDDVWENYPDEIVTYTLDELNLYEKAEDNDYYYAYLTNEEYNVTIKDYSYALTNDYAIGYNGASYDYGTCELKIPKKAYNGRYLEDSYVIDGSSFDDFKKEVISEDNPIQVEFLCITKDTCKTVVNVKNELGNANIKDETFISSNNYNTYQKEISFNSDLLQMVDVTNLSVYINGDKTNDLVKSGEINIDCGKLIIDKKPMEVQSVDITVHSADMEVASFYTGGYNTNFDAGVVDITKWVGTNDAYENVVKDVMKGTVYYVGGKVGADTAYNGISYVYFGGSTTAEREARANEAAAACAPYARNANHNAANIEAEWTFAFNFSVNMPICKADGNYGVNTDNTQTSVWKGSEWNSVTWRNLIPDNYTPVNAVPHDDFITGNGAGILWGFCAHQGDSVLDGTEGNITTIGIGQAKIESAGYQNNNKQCYFIMKVQSASTNTQQTFVEYKVVFNAQPSSHPITISKTGGNTTVNTCTVSNGVTTNGTTTLTDIANKYSTQYGKLSDARFSIWKRGDAAHTLVNVYTNKEMTTKATNGELKAGVTYYVKESAVTVSESTAPKGWSKSDDISKNLSTSSTTSFAFTDKFTGDPFTLQLSKNGKSTDKVADTYFTVKNTDTNEAWVFKTDNNGEIKFSDQNYLTSGTAYLSDSGEINFYEGNYSLTETTPANGYIASGSYALSDKDGNLIQDKTNFDGKVFDFEVVGDNDGTGNSHTTIGLVVLDNIAVNVEGENPKLIGFKIQKKNKDTNNAVLEGGMANYTTFFNLYYVGRNGDANDGHTWYDANGNGVSDAGEVIAKNGLVGSFKTNEQGYFEMGAKLQAGTYKIVETAPPAGMICESVLDTTTIYIKDDNNQKELATDWQTLANGTIIDVTDTKPLVDSMARGGVAGYKYDSSTNLPSSLAGSKFDGLEFYVRNDNANTVMLDTDGDGIGETALAPKAEYKIYTLQNGKSEYSTIPTLLPYGKYTLLEKQGTNKDYVVLDKFSKEGIPFEIDKDMAYNLLALNNADISSLQAYINTTYKTQIDTLKTHYSNMAQSTARTLNYEPMLSAFISNQSSRSGVAIIKYDKDDFDNATNTLYENGYPEPQGDGYLTGAVYKIYNRNVATAGSAGYIMIDTDNDHEGDTKVEKDGVCATLVTKIDTTTGVEYAATSPTLLPNGIYEIVEETPSVGYLNEGTTRNTFVSIQDGDYYVYASSDGAFEKVKDIVTRLYPNQTYGTHKHTIKFTKLDTTPFKETEKRGSILLKKNDATNPAHLMNKTVASETSDYGVIANDYESKYAQGDATFSGTEYKIYNLSNHYVYTTGSNANTTLSRYESGKNDFLDATGIDVDTLTFTDGVYEQNLSNVITDEVAEALRNDLNYSVCYTLTTDVNGEANIENDIPYGTYLILETKAPDGYLNSVIRGGETAKLVKVSENNQIIDLSFDNEKTERNLFDTPVRGGFEIYKYDEETRMNIPVGMGNLEASFEVINRSKDYVWVDTNEDGILSDNECYAPGEVIYTFKTDKDTGKFTSSNDLLPYGTYEIHETYPPYGYLHMSDINPNLSVFFEIREEGKIVDNGWYFDKDGNKVETTTHYEPNSKTEVTDGKLIIYNYVIRGDVFFEKKGIIDMKKLVYVPFKITAYDKDGNEIESHIVFTDDNGYYDSSSEYVNHTYETNSGDEMEEWLTAYNEAFENKDEEELARLDAEYPALVEKYSDGVGTWFGLNTTATEDLNRQGNLDEKLNWTGALPFGKYTIEELRCPNNKNYEMVVDSFTVKTDASNTTAEVDPEGYKNHSKRGIINLGTIYNLAKGLETVALTKDEQSHYSYPYSDMTVIDTVSYENLLVGKTYKLVSELHDVETGDILYDSWGNEVRVETEFTPKITTGSISVELDFDASDYAEDGGSIVAYEYVYDTEISEDMPIMKETDKDNINQQIHFPSIKSELINKANDTHDVKSKSEEEIELTDTISYKGLEPNKTYVVEGYLIDKETLDYATDDEGNHIVADIAETTDNITHNKKDEIIFKPATSEGTFELTYKFNASTIEDKSFVSFVDIKQNRVEIANHMDIDDMEQTVCFPKIGTTAKDSETGTQLAFADSSITIIDTVKYSNVYPNTEYTVSGVLVDKETGETLKNADGEEITSQTTFIPTETNGEVEVTFTFDGRELEGKSIVVFEKLFVKNDYEIANHEDKNDEGQTIHIPKIDTKARDSVNGTQMVNAENEVSITDTIEYTNLLPNLEYVLNGKLIDTDTNNTLLDEEGNEIVSSVTFIPTAENGTVDVTFTFNGVKELEGKTTVAFEDLYVNVNYTPSENDEETTEETNNEETEEVKDLKLIAQEYDIDNKEQTIYFPEIHTTAYDGKIGINITKSENTKVIDTVAYYNLVPNTEYTVKGTLMDKETGEAIIVNGETVEASKTFTTDDLVYGTVDIEFNFDATELGGKTLVAFEELCFGEFIIKTHKDIEDKSQTVYIPKIGTKAKDSNTDLQMTLAGDKVEVTDTIEYENLIAGKEYIIVGQMMNKSTKEAISLYNGEDFDTESLEHPLKTEIIVSDRVNSLDNDEDNNEEVSTETDTDVSTETDADADETKGKKYIVKKFTPTEPNGTVDMKFIFDGTDLADNCTVAFEELYINGYSVAEHKDIEDEGQTIIFPDVQTEAKNKDNDTHYSEPADKLTIVDKVKFSNLNIGEEYTVEGTLMSKETGNPILNKEGKPYISSVTFKAEEKNGYVDVEFTIDASDLAGQTIVVFEDLYYKTIKVGVHADIEDEDQSIHIVKIGTMAKDESTDSNIASYGKTIIVDTVSYEGLIPNKEYVLSGKLMDKETEKPITSGTDTSKVNSLVDGVTYDANEYVAEIKFVPTESKGTVDVKFEVDTTTLGGKTLVVFEKLYDGNTNVANHEDIESTEQSITVPKLGTTAKDKTTDTKNLLLSEKTTIVDTIEYENLMVGKEYTIIGKLVDKGTGKVLEPKVVEKTKTEEKKEEKKEETTTEKGTGTGSITEVTIETTTETTTEETTEKTEEKVSEEKDENAREGAIVEMKFIPTEASGTVDMTFEIDTTDLAGKSLVVFEYVNLGDKTITAHEDVNSETQTVYMAEIKTKATVDGKKTAQKNEQTKLIDTVEYTNLIVGQEYTVKGELVDKKTGEKLSVKAETTFKPEKTSGTVDVEFTVDTTKYESLVVFENLYIKENLIATHSDINDESQTVTFTNDAPPTETKTGGKIIVSVLASLMTGLGGYGIYITRRRKKRLV